MIVRDQIDRVRTTFKNPLAVNLMNQAKTFDRHDMVSTPRKTRADLPSKFPATALLLVWAAFLVYGSLLPFDFQMASLENAALHFFGSVQSGQQAQSLTDWITNVVIFVPLGFFGFAIVHNERGSIATTGKIIVVLGGSLMLSILIEFAQVFFPPRDSSLMDVLANGLGAAAGCAGWFMMGHGTTKAYAILVRVHQYLDPPRLSVAVKIALLAGSCLMVAGWSGILTTNWIGWKAAVNHMEGLRILPFLQHQAADIGLAFISTVIATVTFSALGGVFWLIGISQTRPLRTKLIVSGALATSVAVMAEMAKLFMATRNPDTGNIVVAGLAAGLGCLVAPLAWGVFSSSSIFAGDRKDIQPQVTTITRSAGLIAGRGIAIVFALAAIALVVSYPIGRVQLALALLVYAALLTRYPTAWLLVLPALLPILDLAPWTGRFFFDEFDAFVATTLATGLWRSAGGPLVATRGPIFWLTATGFAGSLLISAVIGLLPLQPMDANSLASYYSHYASLRAVKGTVFAVGLGVLLSSLTARGQNVERALGIGMILGLATSSGSVIWERLAYAGLADFAKDFRVVGLFSTMNTGGSHLDAFLVATLPFAAVWALKSQRAIARLIAAFVFIAGTYAVMMTYSRAAFVALMMSVLLVGAWALLSARLTQVRTVPTTIRVAVGLVLAGFTIFPILFGTFMQSRLATSNADLGIRTSHWNEALGLMSDDLKTSLFGMGLGRYPVTYLLLSSEKNKPAVHRFQTEGRNTFLRIHPGQTYIEQVVTVEPGQQYKVTIKARAGGRSASINLLLCERTFLQGFGCQSVTFGPFGEKGQWQLFQGNLNSASVGENGLRITKLSLENNSHDTHVDIDELTLTDAKGLNRITNGDFQSGADRWYFSSPYNHLPWHIKNLWLEIFFEQGWFGLLLFCALVTATIGRLSQFALRGEPFAAMLLASLVGFLVVGGFDSLFDAPRLTLLFGLLIAVSGVIGGRPCLSVVPPELPALKEKVPTANAEVYLTVPRPYNWRALAPGVIAGLTLLAIAIALVTRMPFLPYRVRELPNPFHPVLAPLLLAIFIFWVFGMPAIAARWLTVAKSRGMAFPLVVALHGLIGWAIVQFAVLPNSIHAVIGSPVLNWLGRLEEIARLVPLLSVFALQLTGGALIAAAITGSRMAMAPIWWLICGFVLWPLQYWVIVTQAATDNLTELMADSASFGAFMLLVSYLLVIGVTGSLLASLRSNASPTRVGIGLAVLAVSLALGYLLLWAGTESMIDKLQKPFSALQSLLSTDRTRYAVGFDLWTRFAVAHLAAVCATAMTQYSIWGGFERRVPRRKRRRSA